MPEGPPSPEQEARRIADELSGGTGPLPWCCAGYQSGPLGLAWVCRVRPGRVSHVLGTSPMADALRRVFAEGGVPGWSLQPLPAQLTPLERYRDQLRAAPPQPGSDRGLNQLEMVGYLHAEEVAATPDDALLALRNVGHRRRPCACRPRLQPRRGLCLDRPRRGLAALNCRHLLRRKGVGSLCVQKPNSPAGGGEEPDQLVDSRFH